MLRVDSPGRQRDSPPRRSIASCVALHAAGKPVVVSMGNYAASGGYYISAPADEIWASPATITGSIGIFAIIPTIDQDARQDRRRRRWRRHHAVGRAAAHRPAAERGGARAAAVADHAGYDEFLARVATGRKKTPDEIDAIAQGRVWAGVDAKRLGLVDQLGSFDDAVAAAARRAKLTDYSTEFIEPELTWAQALVLQLKSRLIRSFVHASPEEAALARLAQRLDPVTREVARLSRFSSPNRLYAYCFCEVR